MSRRESVYAIARVPVDGGESPNAYFPQVTAEIRVFFPPHQREAAFAALSQAVQQAVTDLEKEKS